MMYLFILLLFTITLSAVDDPQEYPFAGALTSNYFDGPYLIYKGEEVQILTAVEKDGKMHLNSKLLKRNELSEISVFKSGFLPRTFKVNLMEKIIRQPAIYAAVERIFAVSDIEGNFNTLVNLLQQHKVIDDQLDWIFGTGHFVLVGDIFDRGNHVTEMLWFLYRLEQQALNSGGYAHILLGNHEALNLRGDLRYIEPKYKEFENLIKENEGLNYTDVIGPNSELGQWLRSKNVIEKIGGYIFVHAGVSPALIETGHSLEKINELSIKNVDITKSDFTAEDSLMWGKGGPYWYRGYFDLDVKKWGPHASQQDVENVLSYFEAETIIVGHTHVEKPELRYNGKVCAIDVQPPADHIVYAPPLHAYGILIENGKFFLADDNGLTTELMK